MSKKQPRNTKGKIISAAWKLFYEQGYDDTTIDEIIAESGTSKGSFYHYFEGKDALLGSLSFLFDEKYTELEAQLDQFATRYEQLIYLNQELFSMIENSISLDLLARLLSTQLITKGEKHLLDRNRYYYKLLRRIIREGQETEPDFVLTYAENQAEDYPTTQGADKFAELVKEKTEGKVEILVNAGGSLGDEKSVIEQLQFGGIDFARVSISTVAEYIPKLNVLQMPYLYTGADHMWKVLEGPIGDDFLNSFDGSGLIALSWYDAGARSFYNSIKPIEKLEDIKGMTIRVQESELMSDTVRALGAVPVPMIYGEVYSGLQTGKVDGAENNWPSYESAGHYEVAKYFTVDEHSRVPEVQIASTYTWNKLPEEYREIIRECAQESAWYERSQWKARESISRQRVETKGCVITQLSPEEKLRFQQAVMPLYEKYCAEYVDIIDEIVAEGW